MAVGNFY